MLAKQESLFWKQDTLFSIDPEQNRYRVYQVEIDKSETRHKITKRWGRVEEKGKGYVLRNNRWQGEQAVLPDNFDDFDSEDVYAQILEQKKRRGYVDFSELEV